MDILILRDGKTFQGDGQENEDYYAFGQAVVAPGDGRIVAAEGKVHDNVPGEMNPEQALGNYVVIDHENGEFSFLAHFKQGTVSVGVGDQVVAGQRLGECGNSGNSSEAHIHYHLQTTAEFGRGEGLPVQFLDYVANGVSVQRGELLQGELVEPAERASQDL